MQGIPRQAIAAVIVYTFHDADGAEAHCLSDRETRNHERKGGADGVKEEGLGEGVVEGAEGIGNVDFVVMSVQVAYAMSSAWFCFLYG